MTVSRIEVIPVFIKDTPTLWNGFWEIRSRQSGYLGGYALILRLTVDDYHHYCYPADGMKSQAVEIPGVFHSEPGCQ